MKSKLRVFLLISLVFLLVMPRQVDAYDFKDVPLDSEIRSGLTRLIREGVLQDREYFHPNDFLSRAELTKIAVLMSGLHLLQGRAPFLDLDDASDFNDYIYTAYINGIIGGYDDRKFRPWKPVSRVEAMKIFMRIFDVPVLDVDLSFDDVAKTSWFRPYINTAVVMNLISPRDQRRFEPGGFIKRGEALRLALHAESFAKTPLAVMAEKGVTDSSLSGETFMTKKENIRARLTDNVRQELNTSFYREPPKSSIPSNSNQQILTEFRLFNRGPVMLVRFIAFDVFLNGRADPTLTRLRNVRIYDDGFHQVAGPVDARKVGNKFRLEFQDDWQLLKTYREPRFKLVGDLDEVGKSGDRLSFGFNPQSPQYFQAEIAVNGRPINIIGKKQSLVSPTTRIFSRKPDFDLPTTSFSDTVVAGSSVSTTGARVSHGTPVLGVVINGLRTRDIIVTNLQFDISQGDPTYITNAYLYDENGQLLDQDIVNVADKVIRFSRISPRIRIAKGGQEKVVLAVNFTSGATGTYAFSFTPSEETVAAQTLSGHQLKSSGPTVNNTVNPDVKFNLANVGSVKSSVPEVIDGRQITASDDLDLFAIRLDGSDENILINTVEISTAENFMDDQLGALSLYADGRRVGDDRFISGNGDKPGFVRWNFTGSARPIIPKDGSLQLVVRGKPNVTNNGLAESGEKVRLFLRDLEIEGRNDKIVPDFGSSVGKITMTSDGGSGSVLKVSSTASLRPGDFLISTDTDVSQLDVEHMSVLKIIDANTVVVDRGIFDTHSNSNDVMTGKQFDIVRGIESDDFTTYATILNVQQAGNYYGERGSPTSSMKVLGFKISASNNAVDTRAQKARMQKLILSVSGGAVASRFKLKRASNNLLLADGIGGHLGKGESHVVFDLGGVSQNDILVSEGTSRDYYIEADVQSLIADTSISASIKDLGNRDSSFGNNESNLIWSDGETKNIFWVDQPVNYVIPRPLTFVSIGGFADIPPDQPVSATVAGGSINIGNQNNVSISIVLPKVSNNVGSGNLKASMPSNVFVRLVDSDLSVAKGNNTACDNSTGSCTVVISGVDASSLKKGNVRIEVYVDAVNATTSGVLRSVIVKNI